MYIWYDKRKYVLWNVPRDEQDTLYHERIDLPLKGIPVHGTECELNSRGPDFESCDMCRPRDVDNNYSGLYEKRLGSVTNCTTTHVCSVRYLTQLTTYSYTNLLLRHFTVYRCLSYLILW